jgi:uncharacterized protein (UPF0332 family)
LNDSAFAQALVKKGERALVSAKANLREGDMDGAVNRAYYAMFNIARAALLRAGLPESELPRSHNGLIGAFGEQAVKVRGLDPDLGRALSKTVTPIESKLYGSPNRSAYRRGSRGTGRGIC